jgi:hypothetical protein
MVWRRRIPNPTGRNVILTLDGGGGSTIPFRVGTLPLLGGVAPRETKCLCQLLERVTVGVVRRKEVVVEVGVVEVVVVTTAAVSSRNRVLI